MVIHAPISPSLTMTTYNLARRSIKFSVLNYKYPLLKEKSNKRACLTQVDACSFDSKRSGWTHDH